MPAVLSLDSTFAAATLASVAFMILYPVVLGTIAQRRLQVSWRYFAYGAAIFLVSQGLTRIPLVQFIQAQITPQLQSSQWLL